MRWVPELLERVIVFDPVLLLVLLFFFVVLLGNEFDIIAVLFAVIALLRDVLLGVEWSGDSFFLCNIYLLKAVLPALLCFIVAGLDLFLMFFVL